MGFRFKKPQDSPESSELSNDTVLAIRAAEGDVSAFETLVRKYERFVSTCVYRIVQNTHDTMDVSQEVFLKMYKGISSFKAESSFSSWLYMIARNCAYDFLRKQKVTSISLDSTDEDGKTIDVADTSRKSNPEDTYISNEKHALVWKAIDSLSEEHKEILVMRDISGMSYEDISKILNLEQGTVKSRLFRARESLRKNLEKENYF